MATRATLGGRENGKGADDLAEDNKRLQEMLHAALRREAEALRRVKHLSELLAEYRAVGSRTPSSGPDLSDSLAPDTPWRREEWEGSNRVDLEIDFGGSAPHSQSSDPMSVSPSLVVSPPLAGSEPDNSMFLFPGAMSAPAPLSCLSESPETLSTPEPASTAAEDRNNCHPVGSLPPTLLAPAMQTIGDVRQERERPPPPPQNRRSPSPQPTLESGRRGEQPAQPAVPKSKRTSVTLERMSGSSSRQGHTTPRSRAQSLLRPSWLLRKSLAGRPKTRPPPSITSHFVHFLERSSHINPHSLSQYIDRQWSDVSRSSQCTPALAKYRSAVWELFQSETKYLCNQLQPLEQVYKAFLEELQFYGYLVVADVQKIFANLSELVELSITVASDLFKLFNGRHGNRIAPTNELILAFSMFGHKWNPVYQRFCVNMEQQRGFVKALKQLPNFQEYIVVCRGHAMVQRNDITDFLIAPMQHQCHYQLLLENVLKATSEPSEKSLLTSAIKAFVVALMELQANITTQQRSEELLELQETLSWPNLASLCPDSYIPEGRCLDQQPCRGQLAIPTRQPLHSGALRLIDSRGRQGNEVQLFLFTDMVLLAEPRSKTSRKDTVRRELVQYTVIGQPLFLDWLDVHALASPKQCFTLVQRNKLKQLVNIHTLQAGSLGDRDQWLSFIQQAQHNFCQSQ